MIKMIEIDAARAVLDTERAILRNLRDTHRSTTDAEIRVRAAEAAVVDDLREWWAQGCQEWGDLDYWHRRALEGEWKLREVPCVVDKHLALEAMPAKIATFIREVWGERNLTDPWERTMRLLEEAIELAQAEGISGTVVETLAARVYSRPHGAPSKEAGDVGITLLAWCYSKGVELLELMARNHDDKLDSKTRDVARLREKQREKFFAGVGIDVEWAQPSTCRSCHACDHGNHEGCGGPESGCGCAAEGHTR